MKTAGAFTDFSSIGGPDPAIDPALQRLMLHSAARQAERQMSKAERLRARKEAERQAARQAKEQAKIRERKPLQATYDLPAGMKEQIAEAAQREGVPASQLAALLLANGLAALAAGEIDLRQYKIITRSRRYSWNIAVPRNWEKPGSGEF